MLAQFFLRRWRIKIGVGGVFGKKRETTGRFIPDRTGHRQKQKCILIRGGGRCLPRLSALPFRADINRDILIGCFFPFLPEVKYPENL